MSDSTMHGDAATLVYATPHWIIRWGNVVLFAAIVLTLIAAALIPYPDSIAGKATIASDPQPTSVVARTSGALTLLVRDGDRVHADQPLAVVETAARLAEVRALRQLIDGPADANHPYPPLRIGELQPYYAAFLEAVNRWRDLSSDPQATGSEMDLALEIDYAERQWLADVAQADSFEAKAALTRTSYDRTRTLFAEKLVAKQDVERAEAGLIDAKSAISAGQAAKAMSGSRVTRYRQALANFRDERARQLTQRGRAAEEARQNLLAQLDQWQAMHLIIAPRAGRVWFLPGAVERQHVATEQPVMCVLPEQWRAVVHVDVPLYRSGQIARGQEVAIELTEYPSVDYAPLRGSVSGISPMPRDEHYVVDATLSPQKNGKLPPLKPGMGGHARIVTHDRSLLARLLERLTAEKPTR